MNDPDQIKMTINGVEFTATWFDKEDDRVAEWYIYRNGEKVGKYAGRLANKKRVENFIEFFLAGR